jgi:hypothetical protein
MARPVPQLCALAAALALAVLPVRAAIAGDVVWVPRCGGGMQPIPVKGDRRGSDCPGACHAACARTLRGDDADEGD